MIGAPPKLSTLILLAALAILPLNIFLPSLANIADEFEVDYGLVSLSLAGYAAVAALLQLVMGPLSDRFGRRPIVLIGLSIFVVGSIGCALASDLWTFLVFRLFQTAIGSAYGVSMAVIRDTTTKERTASKIGYVAMAWAVAPMLGPTIGGLLDEAFGWRAIFWSLGTSGVAMLVLCWFDLGETNKNPASTIGQQFRAYPQLFRSRRFWANAVCMAFSTGTFYAFLAGAPLAATAAFGMAPATLGLFMGSTTAGFMVGSFLSGRYAGRFPLATTMIAGRIVTSVGLSVGLMLHFAGVDHVMALFGPCLFIGVGNGLTMPSASSGVLSVRPEAAGSAGGLAGALTIAGGAALSSLTGALLTENNAVFTLLLIMLSSSLIALLAAFCVRLLDLSEKPNSAKLEEPIL